jgi:hypothetical protein
MVNEKESRDMRDSFYCSELHTCVSILGCVTGTSFEEIIVRLDVRREVNHFASRQLSNGIKNNRVSMMIGTFPVTGESHIADIFAAFGGISRGHFIFGEDGSKWTFRYAGAAINAGIRVNIDPWIFIDRVARDHTFDGANVNAATIANA